MDGLRSHSDALTQEVDGLRSHVETLKNELGVSNDEARTLSADLEQLRSRMSTAAQDESKEVHRLELRCRELEEALHASRVDVDRWENACMEERALKEELHARFREADEAWQHAETQVHSLQLTVSQEKQVAHQLQQTLEELQRTQDHDLQRLLGEMQQQVDVAESQLEKYKVQVHTMKSTLEEARQATLRNQQLEQEMKERNIIIGKLRHEAVILNEHLKNALSRLRRESSEDCVDRRLMSNLILQFLSMPRADAKRYEILRLIASILQWDDAEREKAGLQRQIDRSHGYGFLGLGGLMSSPRKASTAETQSSADESVSNLFVEFLLSEVERSKMDPQQTSGPSFGQGQEDQFQLQPQIDHQHPLSPPSQLHHSAQHQRESGPPTKT